MNIWDRFNGGMQEKKNYLHNLLNYNSFHLVLYISFKDFKTCYLLKKKSAKLNRKKL